MDQCKVAYQHLCCLTYIPTINLHYQEPSVSYTLTIQRLLLRIIRLKIETTLSNALEEMSNYYKDIWLKPNPNKTQACTFHLKHIALSGIAPPDIRREIASEITQPKQLNDTRHTLYGNNPPLPRIKSRKSFLSMIQPIKNPQEKERINR